jgi:hypothetical protein
MNTSDLTATLTTLCAELVDGAPRQAYILNTGDLGLRAPDPDFW